MDSDDIIARAEELLKRHSDSSQLMKRARGRSLRNARTKLGRIILFLGLVAVGAFLFGLVIAPLGVTGVLTAGLLAIAGTLILSIFPRDGWASASALPTTDLALLPLRTEEWLVDQRKALPPPAQRLVDGIGTRLEVLSNQLRSLDEKEPAAAEIRRLVAHDLPELVNGYSRVPTEMRKKGLNGISPDRQLIDGLSVVESELKRMSEQLATGDLNKLATQGRYLELKYQDGVS
jgi:hypothetical protein